LSEHILLGKEGVERSGRNFSSYCEAAVPGVKIECVPEGQEVYLGGKKGGGKLSSGEDGRLPACLEGSRVSKDLSEAGMSDFREGTGVRLE